MAKHKALYGLLALFSAFNPNLVSMFPWMQSLHYYSDRSDTLDCVHYGDRMIISAAVINDEPQTSNSTLVYGSGMQVLQLAHIPYTVNIVEHYT